MPYALGKTVSWCLLDRLPAKRAMLFLVYEIGGRSSTGIGYLPFGKQVVSDNKISTGSMEEALIIYLTEVKHENFIRESKWRFKNRDGTT